jgi:hypothetical protein
MQELKTELEAEQNFQQSGNNVIIISTYKTLFSYLINSNKALVEQFIH